MRLALAALFLAALGLALFFALGRERAGRSAFEPGVVEPLTSPVREAEIPSEPAEERALVEGPAPETGAGRSTSNASEATPPPFAPGGLRVRVVDAEGAPAAGVAVALEIRAPGGEGSNSAARATTRASDGRARLDLAELTQIRARALGLHLAFFVEADVACAPPVRTELEGWPAEEDEVQIVLPPTGSFVVRVLTLEGAPFEGPASLAWWWLPADVAAAAPDSAYERVSEHTLAAEKGVARVDGIGLGLALAANAWADGFVSASARGFVGPTAPGEVRALELRLGPPLARLRLRALDLGGHPLASERLRGELWMRPDHVPVAAAGPPRPSSLSIETDAEGYGELTLAPGELDAAPRLDLERHDPRRMPDEDPSWSVASLFLPTTLAPGERVELGDVQLAPAPVVAEGRVVDEEGAPIAGAELRFLERFGTTPDYDWQNLARPIRSDERGRFVLRDLRLPRQLGLRALAKGFAARTLHGLEPGDRALEIMLGREGAPAPEGAVALEVLLDEPLFSLRLLLRLRREDGGGRSPDWLAGTRIEVDHLAPGRYDVWVETREGGLELGRVEGVEVRAGEVAEDPRLLPFDLRGSLRLVELELVRPDGTPWRRRRLAVDPLVPRADFGIESDDAGRVTFLLPSSVARVRVGFDNEPAIDLALGGEEGLRVELAEN